MKVFTGNLLPRSNNLYRKFKSKCNFFREIGNFKDAMSASMNKQIEESNAEVSRLKGELRELQEEVRNMQNRKKEKSSKKSRKLPKGLSVILYFIVTQSY